MSERYFAYGSNLWIDQMVKRTGSIDREDGWPRRAALADFRLTFNMRGDDGQVFANIESAHSHVLGVVYRCTSKALRIMDNYECGYERRRVIVVFCDGERLEATTYVAEQTHLTSTGTPDADYVQRIVRGARQHGIPETYIREIEREALRHKVTR